MKHTWKITSILILMFLITQFVGLAVISQYKPVTQEVIINQTSYNLTSYNLPYGLEPPQTSANANIISILIAFALAITLMLILMKYKVELFLKLWFAVVIIISLSTSFYAFLKPIQYASLISILFALPLAYLKIIRRSIIFHNLTEILIYPGIAAIFVPLLSIKTAIILLILISFYDMYAVWHAKFMQKMAKYQISKLKIFSGLFIPYVNKSDLAKSKTKNKKIKASIAILGGGDIVFPIIFAGTVFNSLGLASALFITAGAAISLCILFLFSQKGKFYPAMPFITSGCLIGYLLSFLF